MIRQLIFGIDQFNPTIKKQLLILGNKKIINIQICRKPIQQYINTVLNVLSFGQFEENLKNSDYDKLFHLFLYITLEPGQKIVLEKNERINLQVKMNKIDNETEFININNLPNNLTLNILLDNCKNQMGETNFFKYSAHSYNCQNFVLNILSSNNLLNEEYKKFIYQDTEQLFNNLGYLKILSDKITDLGASMNVIKEGGRVKNNNYIIQSILFNKEKYDVNKASLWLYEHNFKFNKVDITDNYLRFRQSRPSKKYKYYTKNINKNIKFIFAYY
jgi:hypothetical protein